MKHIIAASLLLFLPSIGLSTALVTAQTPSPTIGSQPTPAWTTPDGQPNPNVSYDGIVHARAWRDERPNATWDYEEHNGYYDGAAWVSGPPPEPRRGQRTQRYVLGYHPWTVGAALGYYNGRFLETDVPTQELAMPPAGSHWVRDDQGNLLMVDRTTGIIAQIVPR